MDLKTWLETNFPPVEADVEPAEVLEANTWKDIRLFLSSTFIDTQAERDVIVKRVIPSVNRKLAHKFIRVLPVDLRWGVLADQSKNCYAIQSTCLNQVDKCRMAMSESPWFLGIRTERYGWIQNELSKAASFDHPGKFEWIDKLRDFGKQVSITSLECIHASLPASRRRRQPTVFYYKRCVSNYEDIEQDMRWVFDFEHVLPELELEENVKYQYNRTPEAEVYRADLSSLDSYLESASNVKYSTYPCTYEEGGAWYTSKNEGRKSFGVGYMSGLEEFEKMVEKDLLEAIEANFQEPEIRVDMPNFEMESIQHENAMRLKASTFVGRQELFTTAYEHCVSQTAKNSVMVLHGRPGCGKSGVLAAVAARCLKESRDKGDFLFIHGVDSCPGSGYLAKMLRRLQLSLRYYRRNLGDAVSKECKTSPNDVMSHLLTKSAEAHPDRMFVLLVDAVNQFDESMNAWSMWWLPSEKCPRNVRVLLTTLDEENSTFQNTTQVCPSSIQVNIGPMSYEDREEMVSSVLAKYNKRLTTVDDPFLGNQMRDLLDKSTSPLYLTAAAEALRKFGIFEKMREYIGDLPAKDIALLFGFLLDEWIEEYGLEFTQFVTVVICLTKDGVLENELNDIIFFKEKRDGSFNCSFSRIYDSISCFLAASGAGFLRWFHDQLRYAVQRKFLTKEMELEIHTCLVEFFTNTIQSRLCGTPGEASASYYPNCLQRIVHHQIKLFQMSNDLSVFKLSLRNIFFVRERVLQEQLEFLLDDYEDAIAACTDELGKQLLNNWSLFARFCAPDIKVCPQWAHNMASNAPPNSVIALDTKELLPPPSEGEFPWRWVNNTEEENVGEKPMKFVEERMYSSAVCSARNMCCFGCDGSALLFEVSTGDLIHKVTVEGYIHSVDLSSPHNAFWTGSSKGVITAWNMKSAVKEWSLKVSESSHVIYMERVISPQSSHPFAGNVICGTGRMYGATLIGEIVIIDEDLKKIVKTWSTELECLSYCYHARLDIIASGHNGVVKLWNLQSGELLKEVVGGPSNRAIRDMSAHPTRDDIVFVIKTEAAGAVIRLNLNSGECSEIVPAVGHFVCQYNKQGDRILCTNKDNTTTEVRDADTGRLLNKIVAHAAVINSLNHLPDSSIIITAGRDGGMRSIIPENPDLVIDESADDVIISCTVLRGECVTLSLDGQVVFHNIKTHAPRASLRIPHGRSRQVVSHPDNKHVLVRTLQDFYVVDSVNAQVVNEHHITHNGEDVSIKELAVSPSGSKCVLVTTKHGAFVYDTTEVHQIRQCSHLKNFGDVSRNKCSVDIHINDMLVVTSGQHGIWLWNINTTQIISFIQLSRPAPTSDPSMETSSLESVITMKNNEVSGTSNPPGPSLAGISAMMSKVTSSTPSPSVGTVSLKSVSAMMNKAKSGSPSPSAGPESLTSITTLLKSDSSGKQAKNKWISGTAKVITALQITHSTPAVSKAVRFIYDPDRIVYHIRHYPSNIFDELRVMGIDGVELLRIQDTRLNTIAPVFYIRRNGKEIVTAENDGSLRVYNAQNGNAVYIFLEQRSQAFKCFVENSDNVMRAFNANGTGYEFEPAALESS